MTTKSSKKIVFTNVPQWIVDKCLSAKDAAYHEMDTIAVFMNVQTNFIELTIEKLNSTECIRYSIN